MQDVSGLGTHSKGSGGRWLTPACLLLLGMWLVPIRQTCGLNCVPGDLGDARFNGLILEHFYRWLTGQASGLISPAFFYPMPGALTFSDNHWGTAWIYSLYRLLGQDQYRAFDLWYLTGYSLNFLACHWVLRRIGSSPIASALGAFAFTFAMPVIVKSGHAQLTYRFLVPIGLLLWQRFSETGRWRWLGLATLTIAGQFYMSIYLGYFMVLLLGAWALAQCLVARRWPRLWLAQWGSLGEAAARKDLLLALSMALMALMAIAWLMAPYLHFSGVYAFHRAAEETGSMLPRVRSYLLADNSIIWGGMSAKLVPEMPMRAEQQMFFGLGIIGLALIGLLVSWSTRSMVAFLALVLIAVVTLSVGGHSLYMLFASLPGINSIRAVSRIGLVMALPLAILVAGGVDTAKARGALWPAAAGVLALVMFAESATLRTGTYEIKDARARIQALREQLPPRIPEGAMVFVPNQPNVPFFMSELDGMALAQSVRRPTLNGYSGNLPPGYAAEPGRRACMQAVSRLRAATQFFADRLHEPLPAGIKAPLAVVSHPECANLDWAPLPMEQASRIKVKALSLQPECGHYRARVLLKNDSDYFLMAAPSLQPTRVSWQKVRRGSNMDPAAWAPRIELGDNRDLGPHESREIEFTVPLDAADDGELLVSVVIDGRAWLHDFGLQPASFSLRAPRVPERSIGGIHSGTNDDSQAATGLK